MKLIVAEKPSVGRAIAEAVGAASRKDGYIEGRGWIVSWFRGHLIDLAYPDAYPGWQGSFKATFDKLPMIPDEWIWEIQDGSKGQYEVVTALMRRSDVDIVYNACDADREGEGIFRRVADKIRLDKPVKRFWSTSLVPEQILSDIASARPGGDYDGLADAAYGRAKADWLVGMNASRAYSVLYGTKVSAGRVQTPTLAIVVARTRQVDAFKSAPFYQAVLDLGGWEVFGERMEDRAAAESAADKCRRGTAKVLKVERKTERNSAPRLYDLTALQRDASTRAGLSADATLAALQSLYEKKLATYPRTESKFIGEADRASAEKALAAVANEAVCGAAAAAFDESRADLSRVVDDSKVHGHGAILPTELATPSAVSKLSGDELTVMRLVCCRLLAAIMEPATRLRSRLSCTCAGDVYEAAGSVVVDASWIAVDDACRRLVGNAEASETEDNPEQVIPEDVSEGDEIAVADARVKEGKTAPPKLYTDATLLSAMENVGRTIEDKELKAAIDDGSLHSGGLGTPATRAATIEKIIDDGYVERKGRSLRATERGCAVIDAVAESLKTPELTAKWELELSRVERGEATLSGFMKGIEGYTQRIVGDAKESFDPSRKTALSGVKAVGTCPVCGKPVIRKNKTFQCSSNVFGGEDAGYKLLEGCGFKLNVNQCGKALTDKQAASLLAGKKVHLAGLKRKDGATFETDAELGDPPYSGFVRFCERKGRAGTGRAKGRSPSRKRGAR